MQRIAAVVLLVLGACAVAHAADVEAEVDLSAVTGADASTYEHLTSEQLMLTSVFGNQPCATVEVKGFDYVKGFAAFCKAYGKVYKAGKTFNLRFAAWKASHNCITHVNANHKTGRYFLRQNHLHDHTAAEYKRLLGARRAQKDAKSGKVSLVRKLTPRKLNTQMKAPAQKRVMAMARVRFEQQSDEEEDEQEDEAEAEEEAGEEDAALIEAETEVTDVNSGKSFSWLTSGKVNTVVGYQQECGDCWAWTAKTVAESAWAIAGNNLITLSAQQVTDCAPADTCNGCQGGVTGAAIEGLKDAGGFCSEADYPFQGASGTCNTACKKVTQLSTVNQNYLPTAEADLFAMLQVGPVGVAIVASPDSFMSYGGGVYDDTACNTPDIDHAVTLIGYGTDSVHGDYWILKNQWAASWGENGYMRMKRGVNQCKIVSQWAGATSAAASTFGMTNAPATPVAPPVAPLTTCQKGSQTGTCQDVTSCRDAGRTPASGLCPGASNIQCCLPPPPAAACSAVNPNTGNMQRGSCIDAGICNAAANIPVSGACPGAANIQCCLAKSG